MSNSRENPLSLEAVGTVEIDIDEQLHRLAKKIEESERARSSWTDKHRRLLEQRLGVRREKNVPWPGANNDSWPITDAVIRRWKPAITNLVLRAEPVALFEAKNPQNVDSAQLAQEFYHWLFMNYITGTPLTAVELVDSIAQFGKGYTRQGWDYQTERYSRIARVESLFPEGIEPALSSVNQQIADQNSQLPPEQQQPLFDPETFVQWVLAQQYNLNPQTPQEAEMLAISSGNILAGARYVRLVYQEVLCDKPAWKAISPLDVIRPIRSECIESDDFLCITHRLTKDEIARRVTDGFFYADAAAEVMQKVDRKVGGDTFTQSSQRKQSLLHVFDQIEGVRDTYSEDVPLAEIWEIYAKIDINGDGLAERVVLWYHNSSRVLLSAFEYPYPFREWPVTEFSFEYTSRRPLGSRGIAELLSTFQKNTNVLHNARLDAIQITTAPMFKVRSIGSHFSRNVKFRPGARIPVTDPADLEPVVMDMRPLIELLREEQLTKTLAEQYIGIFDPSLAQLQGSGRERRTATEIEAVTSLSTEVQSQDAALFQLSMAKVHQQIWDLWEEFGPEQLHYRITGEEQPRLARKSEISGDYDIIPSGSPISTNRALVLARAREMLQLANQDQSMVVDKYELWKEYFRSHDYQLAERMVRTREELAILEQALQALQQQAAQAPPA